MKMFDTKKIIFKQNDGLHFFFTFLLFFFIRISYSQIVHARGIAFNVVI